MEIVYDLTVADIIALAKYRTENSSIWQRRIRIARYSYLVGFLILALGARLYGNNLVLCLVFVLMAVLFFSLYPAYRSWQIQKTTRQAYRDEAKRKTLASRILRTSAEGLEEESSFGSILVRWSSVDQIAQTSTHTFLSFEKVPSLVIPKDRIQQGSYQEFVQSMQDWKSRAG